MSMMLIEAFVEVGRRHHAAAPCHVQLMPEPRCGMPGSSRSAILAAHVEIDHLALPLLASLREAPITSS
jgi:hypothetical protein